MNNLEEYWDSEAPRLGEAGSTGWVDWYLSGKPERTLGDIVPSDNLLSEIVSAPHLDPYQRWAQQEIQVDELLRPPLRLTDPGAELDPYAAILFSDIKPLLFSLTSNRSKALFRLIWLSFLGLHVPGLETMAGATDDDRWTQLHLVSKLSMESIFPHLADEQGFAPESHAGVLVGKEKQYAKSFGPIKNWTYRCVGPLEVSDFRNGTARWGMWTKEDIVGIDVELVRAVFEQCRMGDDDSEWDILSLAFEAAIDVKGQVCFVHHSNTADCVFQCSEEVSRLPCVGTRVSTPLGCSCATRAIKGAPRRGAKDLPNCALLPCIYKEPAQHGPTLVGLG